MKNERLLKPRIASPANELLFGSGFDGTTRLAPAVGPYFHGAPEQYEDIVGAEPDKAGVHVWEKISHHPNLGHLRIYYEGGNAAQRSAEIVPDESNPSNKILRFRLAEPNVTIEWPDGPEHKARVQAELYGNSNLREFYQTIRLRLHEDVRVLEQFPKRISWFTLFEFWNQPFWGDLPFPFRISIAIRKPDAATGTGLYFSADAQKLISPQKFETIWSAHGDRFKVPYATWMNLEIYYREGDKETGRLYLAVTPDGGERQVILNVHDVTHHPDNPAPSGLTHYNPMKIYTSAEVVEFARKQGKVIQIDWDDFALWKGPVPPENDE